MKLFMEQWHGLHFVLDLTLAHDFDAEEVELGASLLRNIVAKMRPRSSRASVSGGRAARSGRGKRRGRRGYPIC